MTKPFVGFDTLEQLLKAADKTKPLNACPIINPGQAGKYGVSLNNQEIVVSQVQVEEILYCRIVTGRFQALAGDRNPMHDPDGKFEKRSEGAWEIVRQFLYEAGWTWREALVAMPRSLKLLDGFADCLTYDKETGLYRRTCKHENYGNDESGARRCLDCRMVLSPPQAEPI